MERPRCANELFISCKEWLRLFPVCIAIPSSMCNEDLKKYIYLIFFLYIISEMVCFTRVMKVLMFCLPARTHPFPLAVMFTTAHKHKRDIWETTTWLMEGDLICGNNSARNYIMWQPLASRQRRAGQSRVTIPRLRLKPKCSNNIPCHRFSSQKLELRTGQESTQVRYTRDIVETHETPISFPS